jgi:hypothetical protein
MTMLRYLGPLALFLLLLATPASALTAKQKMETCKIGATAEKLTGAKRSAFIKRCMAKDTSKKHVAKKPATKKMAAAPHRLTAKQKMETCKIGADAEQLTGAKRKAFIRKCMAKGDYEPAARKALMKKTKPAKKPAMKKPAAKKKATMKPAPKKPDEKKQ